MKKKLIGLIAPALIGLLIGLGAGIIFVARSQEKDREDRVREWQERRREAEAADARVALESRLVKIEVEMANYNKRIDWIEKVVWSAIVGIVLVLRKEVVAIYLDRRHGRRQDREEESE